jgi:acetyltransferase
MNTWVARDGGIVTIRPIRADDLDRERDFAAGLSQRTGYLRLLSTRRLSPQDLRRLTDIDPQREAALVAIEEGPGVGAARQVGVARFVIDPATGDAEFAMVLADAWQGRGLGRELLSRLIAVARERGVERMSGVTLAENQPMRRLACEFGFRTAHVPGDATVMELSLQLRGDDRH